ncbi:MAG: hypothetical protein ACPLW7_05685 [Minisyncoccia bacterium]
MPSDFDKFIVHFFNNSNIEYQLFVWKKLLIYEKYYLFYLEKTKQKIDLELFKVLSNNRLALIKYRVFTLVGLGFTVDRKKIINFVSEMKIMNKHFIRFFSHNNYILNLIAVSNRDFIKKISDSFIEFYQINKTDLIKNFKNILYDMYFYSFFVAILYHNKVYFDLLLYEKLPIFKQYENIYNDYFNGVNIVKKYPQVDNIKDIEYRLKNFRFLDNEHVIVRKTDQTGIKK